MGSKLDKARAGMTNLRRRITGKEPITAITAVSTGALIGTLERRGTLKTTIGGVPTKPLIALVGYGVAMQSSPGRTTHAVASGVGHGAAGAYGYAAGLKGSLIAGGDDEMVMDEDDEEEIALGDDDDDDDD